MRNHIMEDAQCTFNEECTALYCCLDLSFFIYRTSLMAFLRLDTCASQITLGFDEWTETFPVHDSDLRKYRQKNQL